MELDSHFRVYKCVLLVPILNQMNPVNSLATYFYVTFNIILSCYPICILLSWTSGYLEDTTVMDNMSK
jgi:hypothetical protein